MRKLGIIIIFVNIIISILIDSNMKIVIINNINFINESSWDSLNLVNDTGQCQMSPKNCSEDGTFGID